MQAWIVGLTAELAPASVVVAHSIVSGIFRDTVRDLVIAANPCDRTRDAVADNLADCLRTAEMIP